MIKKITVSTILLSATIIAIICVSGVIAAVTFHWTGSISIPQPNPPTSSPPPSTNTFIVTATLNGTAVDDPTAIILPSTLCTGDKFSVVYTITNTGNQPITISRSATGFVGLMWDKLNLPLSVGASNTITLVIPIGSVSGTINTLFSS